MPTLQKNTASQDDQGPGGTFRNRYLVTRKTLATRGFGKRAKGFSNIPARCPISHGQPSFFALGPLTKPTDRRDNDEEGPLVGTVMRFYSFVLKNVVRRRVRSSLT